MNVSYSVRIIDRNEASLTLRDTPETHSIEPTLVIRAWPRVGDAVTVELTRADVQLLWPHLRHFAETGRLEP